MFEGLESLARRVRLGAALALAAWVLSGCAGTNFVRPDPSAFTPGQTTQQDVLKAMGKPYRTGTSTKNGKTYQTASYAYAHVGSKALYEGVTPARGLGFYYLDGVLIGKEFSSSFRDDATDFDESKVAQIEKGRTTRDDVVRLLGPAGGEYIHPIIKNPRDRALVYLYSQTRGGPFNLRFYQKLLIVSYDESGVVTESEYSAAGTKD
jgi:outer membrane protein assembly factor BamE (lipoprotein component of BamABCDE complex)